MVHPRLRQDRPGQPKDDGSGEPRGPREPPGGRHQQGPRLRRSETVRCRWTGCRRDWVLLHHRSLDVLVSPDQGLQKTPQLATESWVRLFQCVKQGRAGIDCPRHCICVFLDNGQATKKAAKGLMECGGSLFHTWRIAAGLRTIVRQAMVEGCKRQARRVWTVVDFGKMRLKRPGDRTV